MRAPKPPPTSGTVTRTGVLLEAERAGADVARACAGACNGAQMRTPPVSASGAATIARGSIGTAARRWLTKRLRDDDVGVVERALVGRAALEGEVRALVGEQLRRVVLERALGVDDDVERLDVDVDELGGVDRLRRGSRPRRPRSPRPRSAPRRAPASGAACRRAAIGPGGNGPEVEVGAGEHAHDAGRRGRGLGVDRRRCARGRPRSARSARGARRARRRRRCRSPSPGSGAGPRGGAPPCRTSH